VFAEGRRVEAAHQDDRQQELHALVERLHHAQGKGPALQAVQGDRGHAATLSISSPYCLSTCSGECVAPKYSRALAEAAAHCASSWNSVWMWCAPSSTSRNRRFTGTPTSTVETTGTPRAQACRKTFGIPSNTEVETSTRARSNQGSTSASG